MANLCSNTVILKGNDDAVDKFLKVTDEVAHEQNEQGKYKYIRPERILEKMYIKTSQMSGRSYDDAMGSIEYTKNHSIENLFIIDRKEGTIKFDCSTAWGGFSEAWETITEVFGFDTWASFSDVDGEYWVENDPDNNFFAEEYVFDAYGEEEICNVISDFEYYDSEKQLLRDLNTKLGEHLGKHFDTAEEWNNYLEEKYGYQMIKTIERE